MGSLLSLLNLHRNATLKYDIFVDFESKCSCLPLTLVTILTKCVLSF